ATLAPGALPIGETNFYLTETDANGCTSGADNVKITRNPNPTPSIMYGDSSYCDGDMIADLMAVGNGGTFTWSDGVGQIGTGASLVVPTAVGTETYTLRETFATGCFTDVTTT